MSIMPHDYFFVQFKSANEMRPEFLCDFSRRKFCSLTVRVSCLYYGDGDPIFDWKEYNEDNEC